MDSSQRECDLLRTLTKGHRQEWAHWRYAWREKRL